MDDEQKYKEALERAKAYDEAIEKATQLWECGDITRENLEYIFSELVESEDERIRKALINGFNKFDKSAVWYNGITNGQILAWLEKQGKKEPKEASIWKHWKDGIAGNGDGEPIYLIKNGYTYSLSSCLGFECDYIELSELDNLTLGKQDKQEQLYIRFGEIPTDEKSKIYQGEIEVGTENGVSVYPAFKTSEGDIVLGLSLPITKTTLYTQQHLIEYDNRPCYLVKGNYVGKDTDGQYLINNVSIIEEIDTYRVKEEKQGEQKFSYTTLVETGNGGINALVTKELPTNGCDDEQKPSDKVEPKFKVGDKIRRKIPRIYDKDMQVARIGKDYYLCNNLGKFSSEQIPFSEESNYELVEQKPADKIEPKFNVGDWVFIEEVKEYKNGPFQIKSVDSFGYSFDEYHTIPFMYEELLSKWTILDAKDGDILAEDSCIFIIKKLNNDFSAEIYCCLHDDGDFELNSKLTFDDTCTYPATKEECDLLFQKIREAGYEWNTEKKELKEIEDEEYNGEDYGIDSLYHAQRILEKTLGKVDGYQTDDGILSHKCAISAVKKLYEQKSALSEEDELNLKQAIYVCHQNEYTAVENWLKSLKDRVQPKQEWNEQEQVRINRIVSCLENLNVADNDILLKDVDWLKSLKERIGV